MLYNVPGIGLLNEKSFAEFDKAISNIIRESNPDFKSYIERKNENEMFERINGKSSYKIFSDPLDGITLEVWEAFKPKLNKSLSKKCMPVILGTGGEISNSKEYAKMWDNALHESMPIIKKRNGGWFIPSRVSETLEYYKNVFKIIGREPIDKEKRIEIYGYKIEHS